MNDIINSLGVILFANKYPAIREAALKLDGHAFIVASEVTNVNGKGYTIARVPEAEN